MTLAEYSLRMEAYELAEVRTREKIYLQAFLNQAVKATTKSRRHPKPIYQKFEQFFDTQREIDSIREQFEPDYEPATADKKTQAKIFAQRVEEFKRLKKAGLIVPWSKRKKGGKEWPINQ